MSNLNGYDWAVTVKQNNDDQKKIPLSGGDRNSAVRYGIEYAMMENCKLVSVRRIVNGVEQA